MIIKQPTPNKQHVDAEKLFRVFVKSCPDSACSGIRNDYVNAVDSTVSSQSNGIRKQIASSNHDSKSLFPSKYWSHDIGDRLSSIAKIIIFCERPRKELIRHFLAAF